MVFKIDAKKVNILERMKDIIEKNYRDPMQLAIEPISMEEFHEAEEIEIIEEDSDILFHGDSEDAI